MTGTQQLTHNDRDHLRLLSIFFYVYGGLQLLFGFIPLLYVGMGALMLDDPSLRSSGHPVATAMPWFFMAVGVVVSLYIWTVAALLISTGRGLITRRRYILCIVTSFLICLNIPLGTALGVCSLIVLFRPSVKAAFEGPPAGYHHPTAPYPPSL